MLIQCQSCATKYRIDPERIPRRKTFVRCKTCGTPIYIDPDLEGGEAPEPLPSGPIPPAPGFALHAEGGIHAEGGAYGGEGAAFGGSGGPAYAPLTETGPPAMLHDAVPVQCPQCHSRYRVPAAPLQRPNIKLKCSVCGHIFAPAQAAAMAYATSGAGAAEGERMDTLFDDLRTPGPSPAGAKLTPAAMERLQGVPGLEPFPGPDQEHDADQAYLEAVALDEDDLGGGPVGKVPESQKYQLFLKPDQFKAQRAQPEAAPSTAAPAQPPVTGRAGPAQPPAAASPWPTSSSDDDSVLEIDFFDDEETPTAIQPGPRPAVAAQPPPAAAVPPVARQSAEAEAGLEGFDAIEPAPARPEAAPRGPSNGAAPRAAPPPQPPPTAAGPKDEAIDLPDLDEELEALEPMDAQQAADETAAEMLDFEPAADEGTLSEPGLGAPSLGEEEKFAAETIAAETFTAPPMPAQPSPAPAPSAADDLLDLPELDADSATEPLPDLDDLNLDLSGELEPAPAAAPASPAAAPPAATPTAAPAPAAAKAGDDIDFGAFPEDVFSEPQPAAAPADELPPLPELEPVSAPLEELPPLPPLPESAPPAAAPALGAVKPPDKEPPQRRMVPGQQGWFTVRRRVLVLAVVAGLIVGAILGWAGWLMRGTTPVRPFAVESGKVHQLALQNTLEGRTIAHRRGKRLFVVEGQLVNHFPRDVKVSWVRVRGTAYAEHGEKQLLGTTQVYLGNVLTDKQLESWELDAITAYGAYNNGRSNANFEIPAGGKVPFQLVFVDMKVPVLRTVAQVVSYSRNGLSVYVEGAAGPGAPAPKK